MTHGDLETSDCTEPVLILSGLATVRHTGDGQKHEALARPGTRWRVSAGAHETQRALDGPLSWLHLYLPSTLLERNALHELLHRGSPQGDRLLADGMRTMIAAHLPGRHSVDRQPPPAMDDKRLQRVLDYIEDNLAGHLSLEVLAARSCFSPFHFARQFRKATGQSPHGYVTQRRVEIARERLVAGRDSLVAIALDMGFGSQANFIRVFRKATGSTPGQYREQHRC